MRTELSNPFQPELLRVYQSTRLWLAAVGAAVIVVVGSLTGWQRGAWILLAALIPLGHETYVRSTGRRTNVPTLMVIDGAALGLSALLLALPVVAVSVFSFYVVVVVILATRRQATALVIYGLLWTALGLIAGRLEWFAPLTEGAQLMIELVVTLFFVAALAWVTYRMMKETGRLAMERAEMEETLQAEEHRFRTMIENAFDGVAIIGGGGELIYVGASIERILGFSPGQRIGRPMHDIVLDEDVPLVLGELARIAETPGGTARTRVRVRHADGSIRILDISAQNMLDEPSVGGIVANFRDVTEQAAAQAALEESNARLAELVRSKDEFVASVSHELRTPLTAVLGLAEELRDHAHSFSAEEQIDLRDVIAVQAREVAAIVEDLLVAARADIGAVTILPEACDVRRAVDDVLSVLEPKSTVAVSVSSPVIAYADPGRCRQVVRNLLTNALRYGGTRVKVDAWTDGDMVHLAVRDNGSGLSEEDAARVFQPYQSAHRQHSQPASIGLGLTVSRQLARLMDGDLVYRFDGEWSSFELTVPRQT
ncbi:MAG: PAS domain-containing sensor histidine kinase [Acidimicrobiia bacterium]|nr:PAS domain-containing sensor histidine kinase [Acidimicrobiia bacterium]